MDREVAQGFLDWLDERIRRMQRQKEGAASHIHGLLETEIGEASVIYGAFRDLMQHGDPSRLPRPLGESGRPPTPRSEPKNKKAL